MPQVLSEGMFERRAAKDPVILILKRILWSFSDMCFSHDQATLALDAVIGGGGDQEGLFQPWHVLHSESLGLTQDHFQWW